MTETQDRIDRYKHQHTLGSFMSGHLNNEHILRMDELIEQNNATSLLDYGCGKAQRYVVDGLDQRWGIQTLALYDPALVAYETLPAGQFDAVLCTHVMEHILDSGIDAVLAEVIGKATKFVYFHMSTRLAKSHAMLTDGSNVHCTVQPHDWWLARIKAAASSNGPKVYVSTSEGYDLIRFP